MENSRNVNVKNLKSVCDTALLNSLGETHNSQQKKEILESLFHSSNISIRELPTVIALKQAVQRFVQEQTHLLNSSNNSDNETITTRMKIKNKETITIFDEMLRNGDPSVESLKSEWLKILETTYNSTTISNNISTTTTTTVESEDENNNNNNVAPFVNIPVSVIKSSTNNVLCLDSENEDNAAWEALQLGDISACNSARDFLESYIQIWIKEGKIVDISNTKDFIQSLRVILDTEPDAIVFDGDNWEFWKESLLMCVKEDKTSWEAVSLIEIMYNSCMAERKVLLIDGIVEKIEINSENIEEVKNIFLQLLYRLLIRTPDDIISFSDDEISQLFIKSINVILDNILYFDQIDSQGVWLKGLLVRPSLIQNIVSLPKLNPDIVNKLIGSISISHALSLTLIILPLWVKENNNSRIFTLLFEGVVDSVINGNINSNMFNDSMSCIERCVRGIHYERCYEYFNSICNILISKKNDMDEETIIRLLQLLLHFTLPSTTTISNNNIFNKKYRLPPKYLKLLEDKILRRSEKWCKISFISRNIISMFWWKILRWYAADLSKVVARVVKSVCQGGNKNNRNNNNNLEIPWNVRHLVAISYSIPLWRGLEEVLEDTQRSSALNYLELLFSICDNDIDNSFSYQYPYQQKEKEKEELVENISSFNNWWMLMRWCTNACARRGLFIATTEAIKLIIGKEEGKEEYILFHNNNNNNVLIIPVEEFGSLFHLPQTLGLQEVKKQRKLLQLISIRLYIAAMNSLEETSMSCEFNITEMILQQVKMYWVDYNGSIMMPRHPFGEDSLLILLCVYTINKLTKEIEGINKEKNNFHDYEPILQDTLQQLLVERKGFDPVQQLLYYLTTGIECNNLKNILVHRFEAEYEICTINFDEIKENSILLEIKEEELRNLRRLLKIKKNKTKKESVGSEEYKYNHQLRHTLILILQLYDGDASKAAITLREFYSLSKLEAYGRCTELAVGIVQYLINENSQLEELLQCNGIDIYYLSLLCVRRWLRDPIKSPNIARESIEKFMHLGQEKWEKLVANSLYKHVMKIWENLAETEEISFLVVQSGLFPVSHLWSSLLTTPFAFYY